MMCNQNLIDWFVLSLLVTKISNLVFFVSLTLHPNNYKLFQNLPFFEPPFNSQQMRGKDQGNWQIIMLKIILELMCHGMVITALNSCNDMGQNKVHNKFDCEYDHIKSKLMSEFSYCESFVSHITIFIIMIG